jgi:heavy metal efflux system protein
MRAQVSKAVLYLIHKRYLVVFLALLVLLAGVFAGQNLALEAYPDIANMQVRVITKFRGKDATEVERLVTIPLERQLNGIPQSQPPRSISLFGLSVITVIFEDGVDPNSARQQVIERILHADLPEGVEPELDPNASPVGEVYRYIVDGPQWSSMDRKEIQDWLLNREFKAIDGIVESTGFGGPTRIYEIAADPERLKSLGISQEQLTDAIRKSNGTTGGSYIVANDINYMVRADGLLHSSDDIGSVVIKNRQDGTAIRVRDVATVSIAAGIRQGQVGVNEDDDAVEGILLMRRGENPSNAVTKVQAAWNDIAARLPKGMRLVPLYDRTALVRNTMATISDNVAHGIVLVVLVLMLFLFQVRSALLCACIIPFALLTSFLLLNVFKVPANLLSLGAIDFGIIVDGAVLIVEHVGTKLSQLERSIVSPNILAQTIATSISEMVGPILLSTTIIMLSFLPVLSFDHVEGKLFRPLAIMMNFTLFGAMLGVVLLLPALTYLMYRYGPPLKHRRNPLLQPVRLAYDRILALCLKWPGKTLVAISVVCMIALSSFPFVGSEFLPELEEGNIWLSVTVVPTSVSLERSVSIAKDLRKIIRSYGEVTNVVSHVGGPDDGTDPFGYNFIQVLVDLRPQAQWRKQFKTKEALVEAMDSDIRAKRPGLVLNFSQYIKDNMDEAMSGVRNGEYAIKIFGPDIEVLDGLAGQVASIVKKVPGFCDVARDHLTGQPQINVKVDYDKASRYGIDTRKILDVVETAVGGMPVTSIIEGERRFDVVLRWQQNYRNSPEAIGNILLTAPSGMKVPLGQIASIREESGASAIARDENRRRTAVYANIRGRDLGSAVLEAQRLVAQQVSLPDGYTIKHAGQFERAVIAGGRLATVVPITLCMIAILLYISFGAASLAACVMTAVPIALAAGVAVLFLSGTHLSISSGVGFVALFGLCIQNGVVLVASMKNCLDLGLSPAGNSWACTRRCRNRYWKSESEAVCDGNLGGLGTSYHTFDVVHSMRFCLTGPCEERSRGAQNRDAAH